VVSVSKRCKNNTVFSIGEQRPRKWSEHTIIVFDDTYRVMPTATEALVLTHN
jgi:hypothetical protein